MADIEISREGRVQIVRFNRFEKKNAITSDMYKTMAEAVNGANEDDGIGATLFLGHSTVFTSGNDLNEFLAVAMGGEKRNDVWDFLQAIASGTKPLMAAVDGFAVGIGCTMLMHCDYVCATPQSWLQTPFVNLGLVPEAASSLIAPRIMGHQKAFALLAMGEKFDGHAAHQAGLVTAVVESDELEAFALSKAQTMANLPPEAVAISRRLIRGDNAEILERMKLEGGYFAERLTSDEARNAFTAFMQKKSA